MNMFTNSVRFMQKIIICLMLFLLTRTTIFALPPIRTEQPDMARLRLIKEAEKYLGVPYHYGGMTSGGMDCSGLVYLAFKDTMNVSIPRTVETLYPWVEKIDTADLQAGDLVFFNTTGTVSHVGIYAGNGRFIHSASAGPRTGVTFSSLDEYYWKRTYIGAGRAVSHDSDAVLAAAEPVPENQTYKENPVMPPQQKTSKFEFSLGGAVSWNNYIHETSVIRGAGFQLGAAYAFSAAGMNLKLGLELRPEWDVQLGVFRLPLTLSFGGDMFRVFLGPVLSIGEPVLDVPEGKRYFDGGSSWTGEGGITFTPFTFNAVSGKLAVYGELAWQFYYPKPGQTDNWMANLSAATRISTGIRYIFGN